MQGNEFVPEDSIPNVVQFFASAENVPNQAYIVQRCYQMVKVWFYVANFVRNSIEQSGETSPFNLLSNWHLVHWGIWRHTMWSMCP